MLRSVARLTCLPTVDDLFEPLFNLHDSSMMHDLCFSALLNGNANVDA